jgi:3-hydroxy-3-methylglutaryl CoA synthase
MAAAMLQVIFNTPDFWRGFQQQEWYWDDMASVTQVAYRLADAMRKAAYTTICDKDGK